MKFFFLIAILCSYSFLLDDVYQQNEPSISIDKAIHDNELLFYESDEYGFQIKLWKEWNNGRISYIPWDIPWLKFDMPSPYKKWEWINIATINILTYDQYIQQKSSEDPLCDAKCFEHNIIWRNNKYYFYLIWTQRSHKELYDIFYPYLECRDIIEDWLSEKYCEELWNHLFLFAEYKIFDTN